MKSLSKNLMIASIISMFIAPYTLDQSAQYYYKSIELLIVIEPIWWLSIILLFAAIITKKIRKEAPYPFSIIIVIFSVQVIFGFHPLTPWPIPLILLFTLFYKLYILKNRNNSKMPVEQE